MCLVALPASVRFFADFAPMENSDCKRTVTGLMSKMHKLCIYFLVWKCSVGGQRGKSNTTEFVCIAVRNVVPGNNT